MSLSALPKMQKVAAARAAVSDVVINNFSGGIKNVGNEENLKPKYAVELKNMSTEEDSSQTLRFGTAEFDVLSDNIVSTTYFQNAIISCLENGEITATDATGTTTTIWNDTIAGALPGAPDGWSTNLDHIDFEVSKGELIIFNGVDKPLKVSQALAVDYLQDEATGSNVFTPIAKFVTVVNNFTIAAGVANSDDIIISASGTSGVWPGDAEPNNSTSVSIGALTGSSDNKFRGLSNFKNLLIVFMSEFVAIIELGNFNADGDHEPKVFDTIDDLTLINHECVIKTEKKLYVATTTGVFDLSRNILGEAFDASPISSDLGTDYQKVVALIDINDNRSFFTRDRFTRKFLLFLDQGTDWFVYSAWHSEDFKKFSWAEIEGWSFQGACVSSEKRLFFFQDTTLYQYGNDVFANENYTADYITDSSEGQDITFVFELPWIDANARIKTKQLVNLLLETLGTAQFKVDIFVDKFYKDKDGELTPALSMNFIGGDARGYGVDNGSYGGGRRTSDERMYNMPVRFRIIKYRVTGATKLPLKISSIGMIYQKGNYNI